MLNSLSNPVPAPVRSADVLVIGAGQAGLSAAYHLARRSFLPAGSETDSSLTYAVLDAEEGPGGAWRHRWKPPDGNRQWDQ